MNSLHFSALYSQPLHPKDLYSTINKVIIHFKEWNKMLFTMPIKNENLVPGAWRFSSLTVNPSNFFVKNLDQPTLATCITAGADEQNIIRLCFSPAKRVKMGALCHLNMVQVSSLMAGCCSFHTCSEILSLTNAKVFISTIISLCIWITLLSPKYACNWHWLSHTVSASSVGKNFKSLENYCRRAL